MKILPIYQNTATVMYGAFMEGNLPNPVNYDIQTVLNNMVSARAFLQTPIGASQQQMSPNTTSLQSSPAPAWTTVQGFRGKRVLPKVTFASVTNVYQEIVASGLGNVQFQLDVLFATILWHRVASTTTATQAPCTAPPAAATVPVVKTANADGTWTLAEYDFGAEVVINALTSLAQSSNNIMSTVASNMVFLQMQQGSSWVDVTSITANVSTTTTNSEKYFQLPSTVQARRFRLVSKAVSNPFSIGVGTFALHFYGDYASGTAPRVLGKIQHCVMIPFGYGNSYGIPALSANLAANSYGRYFAHYGLSVTDDLKQAANFDVFLNDATVYPAQEQAVSSFTVTYKPIVLEAY